MLPGHIYTAGRFGGSVDFDPGAGSYSLTANGIADAFILKITPTGNLAWAYNFGGSLMDGGTSIALNHNATEIYFTGFYRDTIDLDPGPGNSRPKHIHQLQRFLVQIQPSNQWFIGV